MKAKKRILNLGCGNESYGTDRIDLYPSGTTTKVANLENGIPYKNNTFDEVYSRCFFEHVSNPGFILKEIKRVLKLKGRVILITDNAGFWAWHTPRGKTHYSGDTHRGVQDKHYALYTTGHLKNHFKEAGFKNIKISYLIIKEKNPMWYIRFISRLLYKISFFKKIAYPHIIVTARKQL